jgi:hypothetical protein
MYIEGDGRKKEELLTTIPIVFIFMILELEKHISFETLICTLNFKFLLNVHVVVI